MADNGFTIQITIAGKTSSQKFTGTAASLGRLADCDVPLRLQTLSRKHATISIHDGILYLEDHGSVNGSYINGIRTSAYVRTPFKPTDEVTLGQEAKLKITPLQSTARTPALAPEPIVDTVTSARAIEPIFGRASEPIATKPPETKLRDNTSFTMTAAPTPAPAAADPNTLKAEENIILEALKRAAAIVQKSQTEADQRAKEIYRQAQEKLNKAEETYQRRMNDTYKEVEDIFEKAQADAQFNINEARVKAELVREENEEYVADLRRRTEESCEKLLAEAQKSAREMKEQRLRDADEQINKKTEEITKTAKIEGEQLVARLRKSAEEEFVRREDEFTKEQDAKAAELDKDLDRLEDEFDNAQRIKAETLDKELARRENEFTHAHKVKADALEKELNLNKQNIGDLEKRLAELTQSVAQKQTELAELNPTIDKKEKEAKGLADKIAKSQTEINEQSNKQSDLKKDILRLSKAREHAEDQSKTATENLKKSYADLAAAKKANESETKALEKDLAAFKQEVETAEILAKQNTDQLNELKIAVTKEQHELHALERVVGDSRTEVNQLESEAHSLKTTLKRLKDDCAESETRVKSAQSEYADLRNKSDAITLSLVTLKNDVDTQALQIREKFEHEKQAFAKQEKSYFEQLKLDTMQNVRKYEMDLLSQMATNRNRLSSELTVNIEAQLKSGIVEAKKLQQVIDKTIDDSLKLSSQYDPTKGEQTSIVKLKKRQRILVGLTSATAGALVFWGAQYAYETVLKEATPMERHIAAVQTQQREDQEKRKFNPTQTKEYKLTYLDNVIYTEKFVSTYADDRFQSEFRKALTTYMFKTWRIDEEDVINLLSTSTTLVKTLAEKKETLNATYLPQGIEKMRVVENDAVQKMSDALGSKVRYESFKKFEKQFYENYAPERSTASAPTAAAPAEAKADTGEDVDKEDTGADVDENSAPAPHRRRQKKAKPHLAF